MKNLCLFLCLVAACNFKAQTVCNASGNLMLFTNYDGGTLTINVDQNIPNLKIGICSYEGISVHLTGAFVNNVTAIRYAGFNGTGTSCGSGAINTNFSGVPGSVVTSSVFAPPSPLANSNGYGSIICGYSCNNTTSQGGCNTVDQVEAYFLSYFSGSSLYAHKVQYGCWTGTQSVSIGGNCCPQAPVYAGTIAASETICPGSTPSGFLSVVSASASAGPVGYQWQSSTTSAAAGFANISGATSAAYSTGALSQTTYFRRAASTSTSNAAYSNAVTITVLPSPTVTASSIGICSGASATLSATGGTNYTWSNGAVGSSVVITPSVTGLISVTCTIFGDCNATISTVILIQPTPTLAFNYNACYGEIATLTVSGTPSTTHSWNPGGFSGSTQTLVATTSQVYTITSSTGTNCGTTTFLSFTVNPLPVINTNSSVSVCDGQTLTLSAIGASTYTWLPGPLNSSNVIVTPTASVVYTVSGNDLHGCKSQETVAVSVLPLPTVSLSVAPTKICKGEKASLTVGGAFSYTVLNTAASLTINPTQVSPTITTNYTVTGTAANGCSGTSVKTVTVNTCAGLKNIAEDPAVLNVYPNPTTGEFNIVGARAERVDIINNAGQLIKQVQLNAKNDYKVLISDLSPGIYFVIPEDQHFKQKVIVTK